jgi:hypothetical protein
MSLKVSEIASTDIYFAYLQMIGKWGSIFGVLGAITYRRR